MPLRAGSELGSRKLDQDVDRVAGDAQRHGCEQSTEDCDCRKRIKRPLLHWGFAKRKGAISWHENIRDRIVMAARATKPDTVPSIEDFALRGGKMQDARDWGAVSRKARLIPVQNPAAAHDPGGVLAAASEWPSACNAVTTIDDDCVARRSQASRCSDERIATVDLERSFLLKISAEHAISTGDCHTPTCGTICANFGFGALGM